MKLYERVISDFGGYEKCKDILSQPNIDFIINAQGLREHMLEHRRQHNIFEVGDKVVFDAHFCDEHKGSGYGEITYCTMDKRVFEIDNYYLVSIDEIRHATDAEIKAGKDYID